MTRDEPVSIRRILAAAIVALALAAVAIWPARGKAAPAVQVAPTPTIPLAPTIAIGSATPIACGQTAAGNTTGAANNVSTYSCASWLPLTGPERVYSLSLADARDVDALLGGLSSDLDLLLLTGSSPASCIAFGDNAINMRGLAAGTYYLVVDGFEGASGPFHLSVWCPLAVTATPTPTVTPTPTPRPVLHIRYLPLLLHSLEVRR
jgi:hypothetical protein